MTTGDKIKSLRTRLDLTQKQLSDKIKLSEISIRKYEAGDRTPKNEQLKKIADFFGVSVIELLNDELLISKKDVSDRLPSITKPQSDIEKYNKEMELMEQVDLTEKDVLEAQFKCRLCGHIEKAYSSIKDTTFFTKDSSFFNNKEEMETFANEIRKIESMKLLHYCNEKQQGRLEFIGVIWIDEFKP